MFQLFSFYSKNVISKVSQAYRINGDDLLIWNKYIWRGTMSQFQSIMNKSKVLDKMGTLYMSVVLLFILIGFYFYSQSLIKVEAPEFDPGNKIIITLPDGKMIYTYENLIYEKNGKLIYKGENSTLNLTGGKVDNKKWQ